MKKIMFNDRYELTTYVLARMKTMTRRLCNFKMPDEEVAKILGHNPEYLLSQAPYKVGEIVAEAQSYETIGKTFIPNDYTRNCQWGNAKSMKGWSNKMFVRADMMPHQIRITSVRAERLQDISEEDCLREYPKCDEMIKDHLKTAVSYGGSPKNNTMSRRDVFAHLIDKISGKGTWESNPWVWVYEFELIK